LLGPGTTENVSLPRPSPPFRGTLPPTVPTLPLPSDTSPSPPVTLRLISEPPLTCSGPPRFMFITWAFRGVGAPACPQAPISLGRLFAGGRQMDRCAARHPWQSPAHPCRAPPGPRRA